MTSLKSLISDNELLISMHPSELAGFILEVLLSPDSRATGRWNRSNFCMEVAREFSQDVRQYGPDNSAAEACAVAWSWLEVNWLICRHPEQGNDWYIPTKRGREIRDRTKLRELIDGEELPAHFLHSSMLTDVRPLYLQGRYDSAVFEAFRVLEVSIREAANLGNDLLGTKLVGAAFHKETGPLTYMTDEPAEREALRNLMAGAIGSYKNPQSHRHVGVDATEAREMILLASHLVKIAEFRRRARPEDFPTPEN